MKTGSNFRKDDILEDMNEGAIPDEELGNVGGGILTSVQNGSTTQQGHQFNPGRQLPNTKRKGNQGKGVPQNGNGALGDFPNNPLIC